MGCARSSRLWNPGPEPQPSALCCKIKRKVRDVTKSFALDKHVQILQLLAATAFYAFRDCLPKLRESDMVYTIKVGTAERD